MSAVLPISLCTFVRNEEDTIRDCIESVFSVVQEVVVVDTGSTDKTIDICRNYTDRIYQVGFSDFGSIRTLASHLAHCPWILMLDADERLLAEDWPKLAQLIKQPPGVKGDKMELDEQGNAIIDSWALPRKRWADVWMTKQVEVEAYPDWQVRLYRNHTEREKIKWVRRVHETISGCVRTEQAPDGPTIQHLQNVSKDAAALKARQEMYTRLYETDMAEGIHHNEPSVVDLDKA